MQQTITNLRFALEHDVAFETSKQAIREAIDALTAADRVKVVHGLWIGYPECLQYVNAYSDDHIVCSACEHCFSILDNSAEEFDYCPHCGAKMDLEEEHAGD